MTVYNLGILRLDELTKPGKGWSDNIEALRIGVYNDQWVLESFGLAQAVRLEAVVTTSKDSIAPNKFCTLLSSVNDQSADAVFTSVEHILELMLCDGWVPALEKLLAAPYIIVGQILPRWKVRFEWTLEKAPYNGKQIPFAIEQVNAVKAKRIK